MLWGGSVFFGTPVCAEMAFPPTPAPPPPPPCPLPALAWPDAWQGLGCPDTGLGPVSPASKCGPELPGELEKHWQAAPPPGPGGAGRPHFCGWGLLLGRRWGPGRGKRGRRPGAGGCLPVSGSGRGLVCQRLPPPSPPAAARPPARRASRPPAAAAARSPRGLAGCRLHRRGFAPFSRPLRLPELIWELFISCQKAARPAKQTTLAAGPPGLARRGRPGLLPPRAAGPGGLPWNPRASLAGARRGQLGGPSGCT